MENLQMERWVVLCFILFSQIAHSQDTYEWISIDCGSSTSWKTPDGILWETDEKFIDTGINKQISTDNFTKWEQMNSLRTFMDQNKNCYTISTSSSDRYFIRGMFNYGNYDNLLSPPTFDFQIDGNKIQTIQTSANDMVYIEVIYTSRGDNISICLARIRDQEFPFISTLEAWPLGDNMYAGMNRDLAWVLSYRHNYGTEDWIIGYNGDEANSDKYNRIWEPAPPQNLISVIADTTTLHYTAYEDPPESAIFDAAETQTSVDSITLNFGNSKPNSLNYILTYFTEMAEVNQTRSFDFYVNDAYVENSIPQYQNCTKLTTYAHPQGNLKVELRPTTDSDLPPIISAIEVYTASDTLVSTGTSQDDLDGLAVIKKAFFQQLKGWSGEPCLPNDTTWQWLGCAGTNPPRVTSLNLSEHGLDGSLPNFSVMQGLESIDLSGNNLDGSIPDFLGKLPNLKLLDLRRNNFSGTIPSSIADNKNLKYSVDPILNPDSPPNVDPPKHKANSAGLIAGIVIGVVVVIGIVVSGVLYYVRRQRQQPPQASVQPQQPEAEPDVPQQHDHNNLNNSFNASTDHMIPNQNGNHTTTGNGNVDHGLGGGFIQVPGGAGEASGHTPNMEPDMDLAEYENLVQQHVNQR